MIYMLIEALAALIVLIPIFALLNKFRFHSKRKCTLYTIFAIYLAAVYALVGLPTVQFLTFDITLNLIPFVGMIEDIKNSLLNILLFIPLGFFLPLLWKKFRRMQSTLLFGLGMTAAIELLQLLTFRATDINDLITNTAGALLGYLLFRLVHKLHPIGTVPEKEQGDLWLILAVTAAGMFFVKPLIASFLYRFA